MTIRGVLFDNDGTLVDTYDLILSSMRFATREVLGRVLPDDVLMAKVGIPLVDQLMDFADTPEERDVLVAVYRDHNHAHHDQAVRLFPGVLEGLEALDTAGVLMGVVTSKRAPLATRGLTITGAWPYMKCLIGPDECAKAKPHPEPILKGAELLGLDPAECAYVGDSPFDIQAGNAAGCATVAALWGMFPTEDLLAESPDATFQTFGEFTDWALANARHGQ